MLEIHNIFLRLFLIILSLAGIGIFLIPMLVGIINLGNVLGLIGSLLLMLFMICNGKISRILCVIRQTAVGKIILSCIGIFLFFGIILCAVLSVMMTAAIYKKPSAEPKAIIILGCKVRGNVPSLMLSRRLQTAFDAMQKYPEMICICSGGQGNDENISEAQCMFEWLTARGIDPSRILIEDQSTSTSENLRFSKEFLQDANSNDEYLIATDGFHQKRAQYLAKKEGIPNCYAAPAPTSWYLLPTYWIREWFGLVHAFVFGN